MNLKLEQNKEYELALQKDLEKLEKLEKLENKRKILSPNSLRKNRLDYFNKK